MGDYIKLFKTETERKAFEDSQTSYPYVSLSEDTMKVHYSPIKFRLTNYNKHKVNVGDILLKDNYVVSPSEYKSGMGEAIGIICMPVSHTPDGKVRIVSLDYMNSSTPAIGNSSPEYIYWGGYEYDEEEGGMYFPPSGLSYLNNFPIINSSGTAVLTTSIQGIDSWGYIPSDIFNSKDSLGPSEYKYYNNSSYNNYIPCPYLSDGSQNPLFVAKSYIIPGTSTVATIANPLADFDGKSNTDLILKAVTNWNTEVDDSNYMRGQYPAAVTCDLYSKGNLTWHLPALGELAYICAN